MNGAEYWGLPENFDGENIECEDWEKDEEYTSRTDGFIDRQDVDEYNERISRVKRCDDCLWNDGDECTYSPLRRQEVED